MYRQLKERSDAASYQYNKSAKERNYMQVEVDLVQRLYDITKTEVRIGRTVLFFQFVRVIACFKRFVMFEFCEVGECESKLISMDRQMEMMEKDHRVNLKVYE